MSISNPEFNYQFHLKIGKNEWDTYIDSVARKLFHHIPLNNINLTISPLNGCSHNKYRQECEIFEKAYLLLAIHLKSAYF